MPSDVDSAVPEPSEGGDDPKLSIGQRFLAALPEMKKPADNQAGSATEAPEDDAPTTPKAKPSRLSNAFLKPATSTEAPKRGVAKYMDLTPAELRSGVKFLDDRERLICLVAVPLGAAMAMLVFYLARHPVAVTSKTKAASPALLYGTFAIAIAMVLALGAGAWYRRRAISMASLFFLGVTSDSLGGAGILPLVFFGGLAFLLFIRSMRMNSALQKIEGKTSKGQRPPPRARGSRRSRLPEPQGPPANKRYTPPKPKRPKPPAPTD